tara:strand:+ start:6329 stop:7714 length:1386 start_codon:yes stop_codon:yes gene_type:complete
MTFKRTGQAGEIELQVTLWRDGKRIQNKEGAYDLQNFIRGVEIYESIEQATLECMLIVEDSAGLLKSFTGSEIFKVAIVSSIQDRTYNFRSYEIASRSRTNQGNDIYMVNCCSEEYIRNETTNVFGNSDTIFTKGTEASQIVRHLLKNKKFIGSGKRLFAPKTLNKHKMIIPNWRAFDTIYWIAQRTIRKSQSGGGLQNGFAFWENGLGFHFKSIDNMIDDINNAKGTDKTDTKTGKTTLYTYVYTPKGVDDASNDPFKIEKVIFPNERNFLNGLRHGTWSGYSIGFDPVTISSSIMGTSTDMSVDAYRYSLQESWKNMSHLGKNAKNPFARSDKDVKNLVDYPKRIRYTMLPNQNFDPKWWDKLSPQMSKNYEALVELQAYQWMRFESLKTIKLQIEIPGNLDLYAGSGIDVIIPDSFSKGKGRSPDLIHSGRYMIASLTHKTLGQKLKTELFLVKDSVI